MTGRTYWHTANTFYSLSIYKRFSIFSHINFNYILRLFNVNVKIFSINAQNIPAKHSRKLNRRNSIEPIMKVDVVVPEENMGDIIGDITSRRGNIVEINSNVQAGFNKLNAQVPLAELFGYATAIRSLSRGRASYTMEPSHFERVPKQVQEKVVTEKK